MNSLETESSLSEIMSRECRRDGIISIYIVPETKKLKINLGFIYMGLQLGGLTALESSF